MTSGPHDLETSGPHDLGPQDFSDWPGGHGAHEFDEGPNIWIHGVHRFPEGPGHVSLMAPMGFPKALNM